MFGQYRPGGQHVRQAHGTRDSRSMFSDSCTAWTISSAIPPFFLRARPPRCSGATPARWSGAVPGLRTGRGGRWRGSGCTAANACNRPASSAVSGLTWSAFAQRHSSDSPPARCGAITRKRRFQAFTTVHREAGGPANAMVAERTCPGRQRARARRSVTLHAARVQGAEFAIRTIWDASTARCLTP